MSTVSNFTNNKGRAVPNQFIISDDKGIHFQSYYSIIASKMKGKIYLDPIYWDYSSTTGKYLHQFLNIYSKKEIEKKIKDGTYILKDLNS